MKRNRKKQAGQAILEYVILLSIVMTIMVYFMNTLGNSYDNTSLKLGGAVERQLRSGAAPATLWTK